MGLIELISSLYKNPELRKRFLYTIWLIIVFRSFAQVPATTLTNEEMNALLANNLIAGVLDLLAGGQVLSNFSIMAAGVLPFVMASFIVQISSIFIPTLQEWGREGEYGKEKLLRLQKVVTVILALLIAGAFTQLLNQPVGLPITSLRFYTPETILYTLYVISVILGGAMISVWLSELITEKGIDEGWKIIIFSGATLSVLESISQTIVERDIWLPQVPKLLIAISIALLLIVPILATIFLRDSQRRVPVQYGRRVRGKKVYQGQASYVPLPIHSYSVGLLPIYFALSLLALCAIIGYFLLGYFSRNFIIQIGNWLLAIANPLGNVYWILLFFIVFSYSVWINIITIRLSDIPGQLMRNGGFIPGVRPGIKTTEYILAVSNRIMVPGSLALALLVTALPNLYYYLTGQDGLVPILSMLIITNVVIDLIRGIEAKKLMSEYKGYF